jgi:hypothetical protein
MAIPVITLLDSAQTSSVSSWTIGTLKSQVDSDIFEVNVWNNKGGTSAVSDLQSASVTVVAADGSNNSDVVTNTWVQVRINDEVDAGSAAVFTKIGGSTVAALYYKGATGTDKTNQIIKGTTNDGTAANSATNYCNCKFKVNIPMNAVAGAQTFKIRFQGYYV